MPAKRNVVAISLADFQPEPIPTAQPEVTWIDPRELLIDDSYQRNLSERSVALIRRIATAWDWRKFKAPNVAWTDDGLEVIDGQHTAIGAACRSDIAQIPVLVADAATQSDRAAAFIGLNRDRVAITATQLHAAAITAGDEDALAIEQCCAAAGVTVLKSQPGAGRFKPRETMAVAAIGAIVRRYGERAGDILKVAAEADLAPIQANHIKAVEALLTDPEFAQVEAEASTKAIVAAGPALDQEAKLFSATHRVPLWKGLAAILFRRARKQRKPGSDPLLEAVPPRRLIPPVPPEKLRIERETSELLKAPLSGIKADTRPPRGNWHAGRYVRRCDACDCTFQGAQSALRCADCAYSGETDV